MGRKAEDWGSIVSEGVIFLSTQTDSVEYQSSPLGTARFSLLEKRPEREATWSPSSSTEFRNAGSYISTPQTSSWRGSQLSKHRTEHEKI
jgi:hypothetical protein